MSEIYLSMILRKLISEYCTMKKVTIEDIIKDEKHDLYHKRIKTESCCKCSTKQSSTFVKVISEKQWDALYEISLSSNSHSCQFNLKKCSERFVPKTINPSDLSEIMTLVLYSTNIMHYIVSRLFSKGFMKFLLDHQHTLYHSMDKKMCCKCRKSPTEEILINKEEWNALFLKKNDIFCKNNTTNCCCQYTVRHRIKYSDIDETVLFKIVYLAGPIGVLNKIKENAFSSFIIWTVDADPLRRALTESLNIIEDKLFRSDMIRRTSSFHLTQSYETETKFDDANKWLSKHLRKQKATTEPPLQIVVRDKDALRVRTVHIPHDLTLLHRTRNFTDITSEENNFLVVVHGLSKIVYPIVINEFNTHCRNHMLDTIRRDIFEQHCKTPIHGKHRDQRRRMYLSQKQQEQLFSAGKEKSKIVDLKLMIYILKENTNKEEKGDYCEQLDVIDEIRREIVQSSSGMLNDKRFQETMERIRRAVLQLGGQSYVDKLSSIQRTQNILGAVNMEPKITLYENKNFRGRSQEITDSCPNLLDFGFNNITSSVKCDRGVWILYKRKNYEGNIFVIQEGDVYNKLSKYFNNRASSVKLIGDYDFTEEPECIVYENNFSGRSLTFIDDVENLKWYKFDNRMSSIVVKTGAWIGYRYPNYDGEQSLFLKGKYTASIKANDEGGFKNDRISSFSKIMVKPSPEGNMTLLQIDYDLERANIVRTPTSVFSWTQVNNTSVEQTVTKTDEVTIQREDTYEFRWDRAAKVSSKCVSSKFF
ncbi:uncharacterized protein LOC134718129 [Mytilus trossulus]|uniref:uncharacterized protein LOC134718129 n=1 Tax=Mytilus trossulus TaxID=6551 RepID=UPI003005EFFE